jgi:hypothetical protein
VHRVISKPKDGNVAMLKQERLEIAYNLKGDIFLQKQHDLLRVRNS